MSNKRRKSTGQRKLRENLATRIRRGAAKAWRKSERARVKLERAS